MEVVIPITKESKISFHKWRRRAIEAIPIISNKIFSLRNKMYKGCGFHWHLEKQLGYCIHALQNFDAYPKCETEIMILQMTFNDLFKQVSNIEKEIKN